MVKYSKPKVKAEPYHDAALAPNLMFENVMKLKKNISIHTFFITLQFSHLPHFNFSKTG
jgi:hypothetical protein